MTKFKGTPLFGQDSSPQNTSFILGLIGTGIFWFLLLICALLIKPVQKKPKYKEVQIVLSSTPKKEKSAENPAPAASSSSVSESTPQTVAEKPAEPVQKPAETPVQKPAEPVVKKTVETPVKKQAQAPAKKPAQSVKEPVKEEPVYAKTLEQQWAEQISTKKSSSSDYDPWAAMEDDFEENTNETSSNQNTIVNNTTPAFEGTAAQTVAKDEPKTSSSSSSSSTEKKQTASSGTIKDLSSIKSQTYAGGNAANGIEAETNVKTTNSGSGKVEMVWSNGSSRALLEPSEPKINLSKAASMTIDGSRKVVIQFRVVESGNVPRAEISITPASILSELVRNEIIDQVSKWRFEAADYSATAEFEYKIVKSEK